MFDSFPYCILYILAPKLVLVACASMNCYNNLQSSNTPCFLPWQLEVPSGMGSLCSWMWGKSYICGWIDWIGWLFWAPGLRLQIDERLIEGKVMQLVDTTDAYVSFIFPLMRSSFPLEPSHPAHSTVNLRANATSCNIFRSTMPNPFNLILHKARSHAGMAVDICGRDQFLLRFM